MVYLAPVSLAAAQTFYHDSLTAQGWEWVYTDSSDVLGISIQEFKQGDQGLTVVVLNYGEPPAIVLAGLNVSSGELIGALTSLFGDSGMAVYPRETAGASLMQFRSTLLRFDHPVNWLPTRQELYSLQTDTYEGAINVFINPRSCPPDNHQICFVNFTAPGSPYQTPVLILAHPVKDDATLEKVDTLRWQPLVEASTRPPGEPHNVYGFPDLVAPNTLALIEVKPLTLRDNTPALQRTYHWRQIGLSTPLISSYTLFRQKDMVIEFRADFSEEAWAKVGPEVQAAISSIELAP